MAGLTSKKNGNIFVLCILLTATDRSISATRTSVDRRLHNSKFLNNNDGYWSEPSIANDYLQNGSHAQDENRYDRFFSIFTVIVFANLECSSGGKYGFCITKEQCSDFGGFRIGTCAKGFGTCCYKALTSCGGSTSMNVTHLQNPNFPSGTSTPQTCTYSITRPSSSCQIRLDFYDFQLSQPDTTGTNMGKCLNDKLTIVSGTTTSTLTYLCGNMPPTWHYYLDVEGATNPTQIQISLASGVSLQRKWNIKVTMVGCEQRIPQGCGQYFTGTSGEVYSFNWKSGMYLHGMNYAICFRRERNYCSYSIADVGPSWIACPDVLKIPTADAPSTSNYRHCLLPSNAATNSYPSSIANTYNGPWYMYHSTLLDNQLRTVTGQGPDSSPGFAFSWKAIPC